MENELQAVRDIISEAILADELRQSLIWCVERLPRLYRDLGETYDHKYSEQIKGLIQAMLQGLRKKTKDSPDAPRVAEAITRQLLAMHERLGIPGLDLTPPPSLRKTG